MIELLVTVGILGILSTTAIGIFAEYRRTAYRTMINVEARGLFNAIHSYGFATDEQVSVYCSNYTDYENMLGDDGLAISDTVRGFTDQITSGIFAAYDPNMILSGESHVRFGATIRTNSIKVLDAELNPDNPVLDNDWGTHCNSYAFAGCRDSIHRGS